jgi:hypothetical protein
MGNGDSGGVHRMVTSAGQARMDDAGAMDPVDATQPTVAMEPVGAEPCPHCGATLALDQRYCLECGAPRTYLSGMLLEQLRTPAAQAQPGHQTWAAGPNGAAPFGAPAASSGWQRAGALTLIAGIGVLLLAMGVGVLIGRSGGSSGATSAAPQVISVGAAPSTGVVGTSTTPTTPAESLATKAGAGSSSGAKHKAKGAAGSSGADATPSKPAPATVLKNLRTGVGGQSYEQKSKNLPNVVETG